MHLRHCIISIGGFMGKKKKKKLHQLNNQEIIEIVNKRNRYYLSLIVKIGLAFAVLLLLIQIIIMGNHVAWYYSIL